MDELLASLGLKFEELTEEERNFYLQALELQASSQLTLEKWKEYITAMKNSVAEELAVHDMPRDKELLMKGRLKNYILMEAFFQSPEKAKRLLQMMTGRQLK